MHWVGEGSSIIICLARDPKEIFSRYFVPKKSSVYYSYDYGETYEDKSNFFKVGDNKTIIQLDKFCIHPKFSSRVSFFFLCYVNIILQYSILKFQYFIYVDGIC